MQSPLLLTSFQTWLPHQESNASDDLLALVCDRPPFNQHTYLRHLPVDTTLASQQVCTQIDQLQPSGVICCGMAESRSHLTLEAQACEPNGQKQYSTTLALNEIVTKLAHATISHDAGKFVCEGLYFHVLKHLATSNKPGWALFVHVPCLSLDNTDAIVQDFSTLLQQLDPQNSQP